MMPRARVSEETAKTLANVKTVGACLAAMDRLKTLHGKVPWNHALLQSE